MTRVAFGALWIAAWIAGAGGTAGCGVEAAGRFDGFDDPTAGDGTRPVGDDGDDGGDDDDPDDGWPAAWADLEDQVLAEVNALRARGTSCGGDPMPAVPPLEMDALLQAVARAHSGDMANSGYFDHTSPITGSPFDRMADAGFTGAQPWGENIAVGTPDPAAVVLLWADSPGHCRNMLLGSYQVIGVGYAAADGDGFGGHYWTQNFAGSH
jgi:uncharacterized protein YkwD